MAKGGPQETNGPTAFLSRDEEWALARAWLDDQDYEARAKIIAAYQPMAQSYAAKNARSGLSYEDLLQEANMGLLQALDRFNPDLKFGFSTFCRYHIISRLQIYSLEHSAPVRIFNTAPTKALMARFNRRRREIEAETGAVLDEEGRDQICQELGIDRGQLERFEMAVTSPVPLDAGAGINGDEATRPVELIDEGLSPEEGALERLGQARVREIIDRTISEMGEREQRILDARHRIDPQVTLEALSKEFRISRERVRQIELRALAQLRAELERHGIDGVAAIMAR
jgi:RNA polymerase sigma-32 factor